MTRRKDQTSEGSRKEQTAAACDANEKKQGYVWEWLESCFVRCMKEGAWKNRAEAAKELTLEAVFVAETIGYVYTDEAGERLPPRTGKIEGFDCIPYLSVSGEASRPYNLQLYTKKLPAWEAKHGLTYPKKTEPT